jgi:hypothetical protein
MTLTPLISAQLDCDSGFFDPERRSRRLGIRRERWLVKWSNGPERAYKSSDAQVQALQRKTKK